MRLLKISFTLVGIFLLFFFIFVARYTGYAASGGTNLQRKADINESRGVVSFTFDDGLLSQYDTAYPLMKKFGYNGTIYVITNRTLLASENIFPFGKRKNINLEQAREMQNNGWEIGSHSLNHVPLTSLSSQELFQEMILSQYLLEEKGLNISTIAFPYGFFDEKVITLAKGFYAASRTVIPGYNNLSNLDKWHLRAIWMENNSSSEDICSDLKYAKENKYWAILIFHHITPKKEADLDITEEDFKRVLECVKASDLEVRTVREVVQYYDNVHNVIRINS